MKYKKEDLEQLILVEDLSYAEIGRRYGVSGAFIKKRSKKFGIELPNRSKRSEGWSPHNKGTAKPKANKPAKRKSREMKNCVECSTSFFPTYKNHKCCSKDCSVKHKTDEKYRHYLENQEEYCKIRNMTFIKKHISKEQNHECDLCGNPKTWNGKELSFILDHVDGDASNNKRNNLRLICPNCDSQLPTFKSRNRNSARKGRYLRNYKN